MQEVGIHEKWLGGIQLLVPLESANVPDVKMWGPQPPPSHSLAMTLAHVGYMTEFVWGQRHPPGEFRENHLYPHVLLFDTWRYLEEEGKHLKGRVFAWPVCWMVGVTLPDWPSTKEFTCYLKEIGSVQIIPQVLWSSISNSLMNNSACANRISASARITLLQRQCSPLDSHVMMVCWHSITLRSKMA